MFLADLFYPTIKILVHNDKLDVDDFSSKINSFFLT